MELLSIILVFLLLLAVVTAVGHGIWVLLFGTKRPRRTCVFCGQTTSMEPRCDHCGRDLESPRAAELADLVALKRQLYRFAENGTLKREVVGDLLSRVERYREELFPTGRQKPEPPIVAQVVEEAKPVQAVAAPPAPAPRPAASPSPPAPKPSPAPPPAPQPPARPAPAAVEPVRPVIRPAPQPIEPAPVAAAASPAPAAPARRPPPFTPPSPKSWTELLAGFMEERNIRWGELIGGLLVVGSAVALVISLWDKLERIPYIQFFIFATISAAVFGVGLYAHYRWKLEWTSRGLLVIATLLVPLNFVAMAVLTTGDAGAEAGEAAVLGGWNAVTIVSELVSLAMFVWLVAMAAGVLVPGGRLLVVLAVVGNSAAVLLAAGLVGPQSPEWLVQAVGGLAMAIQLLAVGVYLARVSPRRQLDISGAGALFCLLGLSAFAATAALGLLVAQAAGRPVTPAGIAQVLPRLSALLAAAGIPGLAGGTAVVRGTRRDAAMGPYHLAGTVVAMVGVIIMLAALGLAWPQPRWIIAVGTLDAAALALAAFRWQMPALHAGAIACLTLVYLTAFHLVSGSLADLAGYAQQSKELLRVMASGKSGMALAGLFLGLAAVSELLARRGQRRHGAIYMAGSALVAIAGLALVTVHGLRADDPSDPLRAAILFGIYGAGCLALVARWRRAALSYLGLALVSAAPLWALWWHPATHHVGPLWAAVLAGEALALGTAAALLRRYFGGGWIDAWALLWKDMPRASFPSRSNSLSDLYRIPLAHVAEIVAPLALVFAAATAWLDRAEIVWTPVPVIAAACLAAFWLLMAWQYRSPARTWMASLIAMVAAVHTLAYNYTELVPAPWVIALLGHATVALAAVVWKGTVPIFAIRPSGTSRPLGGENGDSPRRFLVQPLEDSALLGSALALAALAFTRSPGALWLAGCFPWLAAVWLVLAWRKRSAALFAAHQAALTFGALAATTAWLKHVVWVVPGVNLPPAPNLWERIVSVAHAVLEPRNLQAYGIALGLLSLVWIAVRIVDRSTGGKAARLVQAQWTVDRIVRHIVVGGQFLFLALHFLPPGIAKEHGFWWPPPGAATAFGPAAWLLAAVLGIMLAAALWERWREAELVGTLLLAAALAGLIAGRFDADVAVASALRWTLALTLLACSAAVWQRHRLLAWARLARTQVDVGRAGPSIARAVILATTTLPVLVLTVLAAMLRIGGVKSAGPVAGSLFDMPATWSYLVPLALVTAALVGHALRERSAAYAFSAGLVLEMIVTLGFTLHRVLAGQPLDVFYHVTLLQLATITAAAWAIVWLVARRWVDVWRETPMHAGGPPAPRILMTLQIGIALAGNAWLVGWALAALIFAPEDVQEWTIAAGSPLGWIALLLPVGAMWLRDRRVAPNAAGLFGMAVMGLVACTVRGLDQYPALGVEAFWGYRTLMVGWAAYALFAVMATWWVASLRTMPEAQGPPQRLVRMAAVWVRVAGILAVLLGLKAAVWHSEQLWAAAAIAIASGAGATMAVWRRREGWAFSAALGVNLAASLVVWHFHRDASFAQWWVRIVQANIIASAAVALAWLAARKRLYQLRDLSVGESPLLALQAALPAVGNSALLVLPVAQLLRTPEGMPAWMFALADPAGWVALALAAAAAGGYLQQTLPSSLMHVLGSVVLGLGVLTACGLAPLEAPGGRPQWLAYHILTAAWSAGMLLVLGAAMLAGKWRLSPFSPGGLSPFSPPDTAGGLSPFSPPAGLEVPETPTAKMGTVPFAQGWITLLGALVLALAVVHFAHDPLRPWWAIRAVLSVSLAAGLLAMWLRRPAYVYFSGLLLNVAGTILWWDWGPLAAAGWSGPTVASLAQANALALAVGSMVWALLKPLHPQGVPHPRWEGGSLPFARLAAWAATALVASVAVVSVGHDLLEYEHLAMQPLDWIALAAVTAAATIGLWDHWRGMLPALYTLGLSAVGMGLVARDLTPRMFSWSAVNELAGFVLVAAILSWILLKAAKWWGLSAAGGLSPFSPADGPELPKTPTAKMGTVPLPTPSASRPHPGPLPGTRSAGRGEGDFFPHPSSFIPHPSSLIPHPSSLIPHPSSWFFPAQAALTVVATALAVWITMDFAFDGAGAEIALFGLAGRWAALPALLMLLATAIVMAACGTDPWRDGWQDAAFAAGVLLSSGIGWAGLAAQREAPWLHRSVTLMVSAAMLTLMAGFGLGKVLPFARQWIARGRRNVPWLGGLALAALAAVLAQEADWFIATGAVPMSSVEIGLVAAALVGLAAGCTAMAVRPGLDPLALSNRARQAYVYATEAILVLAGLHIRFTLPWLFHGYIQRFWMLIVMAVAFAGAGLSEWFHRRKLDVLSQPLARTALLLPLLPAVGFWFAPPGGPWGLMGQAPAVWFLMGLFYGIIGVTRRSPAATVLGIVTANVGLWVMLHQLELGLLAHPQLWLVPIALAALVAEYLNHDRLTDEQSTAFRYLCLSVIYISSTAEMFIAGMAEHWWLPVVLMVLSVAGMLAGILLRIRSFLYMGLTFLLLDLLSIIRHAAMQQTWVWYASGLVLGAAIIALFAVFEKRRNDVLAAMERLKEWKR